MWLSRPDGELFAFAGIWAELPLKRSDDVLHSCAIVTCPPNELIRPIHDRMPVVLDPDAEARLARPGARRPTSCASCWSPRPRTLLVPREVSDLVNNVREDGPALIEPREEQTALF